MKDYIKPRVVISKCIEFEHCRWNGNLIKSPVVDTFKSHIEFQPICAEVEIGLGIPRNPIRIIKEERLKLIQPSTSEDLTEKMESFSNQYLNSIDFVDGFILKSQSPSCGIKETKFYHDIKPGSAVIERGAGLFGRAVLNRFPYLAIETEGRLRNFRIREHWLIKLYTTAKFRSLKDSESQKNLVEFHSKNKFLFMAYNQNLMRAMGRIVANPHSESSNSLLEKYEKLLFDLLKRPPNYTSHINILMHMLGYFKKTLNSEEKAFFLDELEKFRAGWIPLFVIIEIIKSWITRTHMPYLQEQSYLNPYPEELMNFDITDTWRGRTYWNPRENRNL